MRLENYPQCATQLDSQNHMKRAIDKVLKLDKRQTFFNLLYDKIRA